MVTLNQTEFDHIVDSHIQWIKFRRSGGGIYMYTKIQLVNVTLVDVVIRNKDLSEAEFLGCNLSVRTRLPRFARSDICFEVIMKKQYYIYLMTNKNNSVNYTGVTSDLVRRVYEDKEKPVDGLRKDTIL